jgi:hypothetical protein
MYDFPLERGKTWRQTVPTISPDTQLAAQILVFGNVQGQTVVTVPAGAFNTTYVFRILQLDDEQFCAPHDARRCCVVRPDESAGA